MRGWEGNSDVKQGPRALLTVQAQGGLGIDDPSNKSQPHVVLDFTDALNVLESACVSKRGLRVDEEGE